MGITYFYILKYQTLAPQRLVQKKIIKYLQKKYKNFMIALSLITISECAHAYFL